MSKTVQRITPFLWFDNQAAQAAEFYVSVFENSRVITTTHYSGDAAKASGRAEGTVMTVAFELDGQKFVALNGGPHFKITEAVSFVVNCESQEEIDYYWGKLSAGGNEKAQQCGWLKDRYGVSWQVVPTALPELLSSSDPKKAASVMKALLQMKKIDIEALRRAA